MYKTPNKPHKHAEVIKAWADGATVQVEKHVEDEYSYLNVKWVDEPSPTFEVWANYRIKPEPKPDTVCYAVVNKLNPNTAPYVGTTYSQTPAPSAYGAARLGEIKIVLDGETGKLKKVELLTDAS